MDMGSIPIYKEEIDVKPGSIVKLNSESYGKDKYAIIMFLDKFKPWQVWCISICKTCAILNS